MKKLQILLLISSLLVVGIIFGCTGTKTEEVKEFHKLEQAEIYIEMETWFTYSDFVKEGEININVYNFGSKEGKNLEITCEIYDFEESIMAFHKTPIHVETRNIGNLASESFKFETFYIDIGKETNDMATCVCYLSNCTECRNLNEVINMKDFLIR